MRTNNLCLRWYDADYEEDEDVSQWNILESKANKFSLGDGVSTLLSQQTNQETDNND